MHGGTFSRLTELERLGAQFLVKMVSLHGRMSPAVADVLMGAGNKLDECLRQVRAARRVAADELGQTAGQVLDPLVNHRGTAP